MNAFMIVGTQQAVSRFVGRDPANANGIRRSAYKLQAMLGGGIFLVMFFGAPVLATSIYGDPGLATPFRYASLITLFYAFYAIFMGYLNGTKQFGRQAIVDFSYSTAKCAFILGFAYLASGSLGKVGAPVAGFAAAAFAVFVLGRVLSGPATGGEDIGVKPLFVFQSFTMLFAGFSSFVLQFDLHVLKILGPEGEAGRTLTGLYGAAQPFSQIPFTAVFAVTFILFPLVSGAAESAPEKMRGYIRETTRYASVIATAIVALFVACPERTLTILYAPSYAEAATALRFLVLGYLAYSPFYIQCAILNAAGRPKHSVALIALVAVVQVGVGAMLVGRYGMNGVAFGTLTAMATGLVAMQFVFRRLFDQPLVLGVFARTLVAGAIVAVLAHVLLAREAIWGGAGVLGAIGGTGIVSKLVTVVGFGVLGLVFLGLLFPLRVLDAADREKFLKVVRRG
ncbi:MAG: oligosaccharide flippase family protein [Planctomycetota bacterium]